MVIRLSISRRQSKWYPGTSLMTIWIMPGISQFTLMKCELYHTHPSVAEPLASGDFVVQQQDQHSFSQTSMDQTIELTINRNSKPGGQTGFSSNTSAVHRWILSYSQRAEISRNCTDMPGKATGCSENKDLSKSRCEKDEKDVQNLIHSIQSMQNPFTYYVQNSLI